MTTPQRLETVRRIQTAMATGYSALGAWCLFHPSSVIKLALTPPHASLSPTTVLLMRCFGAQAMTCGLVLGTSQMTEGSFACFGLAMVPYIVGFNLWCGLGPMRTMFTRLIWLDFAGNLFFGLGSAYCVKLLRDRS